MRNGFHTVFLYDMVKIVKQLLNLKSFPSRTQPSPPFLPLNANFCGLKFPFRANRFTRGRISALLKIPLSRAEWNPFRKKFYNPLSIHICASPAPSSNKKKNVRFAHCCRAPLPFRNFDSNNTTARRTLRRTRKITPPAGNGDAAIFHGKTSISRLGFLLANAPRNSRKFPYPAQTRANPRKTRRRGMLQRAAAIRRAAESKKPKTPTGIFHVPYQRARMLSVVASAARARSPSACAALIKQISHALGAK